MVGCWRWSGAGGSGDRRHWLVGGLGWQAEDLAAVQTVTGPQRCGPGAEQGIDQVFTVLAGSVTDR